MIQTTLGFLLREEEVLLAKKKRGFGAGKWNGFGGKLETGESFEKSLMREAKEEIGVSIIPTALFPLGRLTFHFLDQPEWDTFCKVYTISEWKGVPSESEEMAPAWFSKQKIPYEHMWVDDPFWLPYILSGKNIEAVFYFGNKGAQLIEKEVRVY